MFSFQIVDGANGFLGEIGLEKTRIQKPEPVNYAGFFDVRKVKNPVGIQQVDVQIGLSFPTRPSQVSFYPLTFFLVFGKKPLDFFHDGFGRNPFGAGFYEFVFNIGRGKHNTFFSNLAISSEVRFGTKEDKITKLRFEKRIFNFLKLNFHNQSDLQGFQNLAGLSSCETPTRSKKDLAGISRWSDDNG
jgi:hypothetical protein